MLDHPINESVLNKSNNKGMISFLKFFLSFKHKILKIFHENSESFKIFFANYEKEKR